jgi:hypothetical protein
LMWPTPSVSETLGSMIVLYITNPCLFDFLGLL